MERAKQAELIEQLIRTIDRLLPEFLADPIDRNISTGNAAVCVIDETGRVYGRMFGTEKIKQRASFRIAWTKASQVWITGVATGKFEELVFTRQLDDRPFGIIRPDFIGWEGGLPVALDGATRIAVGFSGFRGVKDVEIVTRAVSEGLGIS